MSDQHKWQVPIPYTQTESGAPPLGEPRICHNPNCDFQTHDPLLHRCMKCGRPIWTTTQFRLISAPLIFLGFILMAIGGGLLYAVSRIDNTSGTKFTGSESQMTFILGIFVVIFAFGVSVVLAGLWQVIVGRASRHLIRLLLVLFGAILVIIGVGKAVLIFLED